jgi:hypothetical protein
MPFHTRDFKELFGLEHPTIQFLLHNDYIETTGPPPKGRGSRRSYSLDAAFRIGLISRLRRLGMEIPASHRLVGTLDAFLKMYKATITPEGMDGPQYPYRPFDELWTYTNTDFFLEIVDQEWIAIHTSYRDVEEISYAHRYLNLHDLTYDNTRTRKDLLFADVRLQINLTSISHELTHFVQAHSEQFTEFHQ